LIADSCTFQKTVWDENLIPPSFFFSCFSPRFSNSPVLNSSLSASFLSLLSLLSFPLLPALLFYLVSLLPFSLLFPSLFFPFSCFSPRLFQIPCSPFFPFSFSSLFSSRFSSRVFSEFHQFLIVELGSYVYYVSRSFTHKILIFNSSPKGSSPVGESFLLYLFFFLLHRAYGLRREVLDNFDVSLPFPGF